MVQRFLVSLITLVAIALMVIILGSVSALASGDPIPIACPNHETTLISGADAPAGESLLAYLGGRSVGGGSTRLDGSWSIPLQVNERPGAYLVQVKLRSNQTLVASFTCYIDIPLATSTPTSADATDSSATLERAPTALPTGASRRTSTSTSTQTTTRAAGGAANTSGQGSSGATTATRTSTPTRTPTPSRSATPTPTGTPTKTPTTAWVMINQVNCPDPAFSGEPDDDTEYVLLEIKNTTTLTLTNWRIVNASRNITYTFPTYTFSNNADTTITVHSAIGDDDLASGYLYWDRSSRVWYPGDRVEIYNAAGKLSDSYTVATTDENCNQ